MTDNGPATAMPETSEQRPTRIIQVAALTGMIEATKMLMDICASAISRFEQELSDAEGQQ